MLDEDYHKVLPLAIVHWSVQEVTAAISSSAHTLHLSVFVGGVHGWLNAVQHQVPLVEGGVPPRWFVLLLGKIIHGWFTKLALVVNCQCPKLAMAIFDGRPISATGALVGLVDEKIRQISWEHRAAIHPLVGTVATFQGLRIETPGHFKMRFLKFSDMEVSWNGATPKSSMFDSDFPL